MLGLVLRKKKNNPIVFLEFDSLIWKINFVLLDNWKKKG